MIKMFTKYQHVERFGRGHKQLIVSLDDGTIWAWTKLASIPTES